MDDYDIVSTIGRGASGKVYLVRSKDEGRQFALKEVLLDSKSNTKQSVMKEAQILSKLKHPNIVVCHRTFLDQNDEHLYILQDYCDGGTLQDKIFEAKEKEKLIDEQQIMQWFVQITMAVQHIHLNKILHRDLKTQNVFLTKQDVVKIGDFGIARIMENTVDMAKTCCGTPCYLSPELCQDVPYSSKSDIWALGCLLYEICSLKPAFSANNIVSLFYKIVSGNFEPLPDSYSKEMNGVISQLMTKTPEDRPCAGVILNIPFVREHLLLFIEGKELYIKEHYQHQRLSAQGQSTSPTILEQRAKKEKQESSQNNGVSVVASSSTTATEAEGSSHADYPDDFEELSFSEDEYSDDFDDTLNQDESLKQPMAAAHKPNCNLNKSHSYSDEEFEDDDDDDR